MSFQDLIISVLSEIYFNKKISYVKTSECYIKTKFVSGKICLIVEVKDANKIGYYQKIVNNVLIDLKLKINLTYSDIKQIKFILIDLK